MAEYVKVLESIDTWIFNYSATTVEARYLDVHKTNNTSGNYFGSFPIKNLSLKKHHVTKKTAVHRTVPPYNVFADWLLVVPSIFLRSCKAIKK